MHDAKRKEYEDKLVGRKIVKINWSDEPCVGQPADSNEIGTLELEDGTIVAFHASGQVDVDVVWIEIEEIRQ